MDNNKKLLEGLLKADGIDPANITESERMVFRQMLESEKKRMKRLSWLSVGALWIFVIAILGLCVSEKILEVLRIPFVVACLGLMAMMCFIFITRFPLHNRKLKESNKKISKLHYLVHGKHRGVVMVGRKDGRRVINWPGILKVTVVNWMIISLAGAGVHYLLCQRWIYSALPMLHIFYCTVISLSFVIYLLREGLKTPLDELVEVKAQSKQSKLGIVWLDTWRLIMQSKITKFAIAAMIVVAVLIGINQFGGSIDGSSVVWASVAERFRSVPFFKATIYIKEDALDRPEQIEIWRNKQGLARLRYGSQVVFAGDGKVIQAFDLESKSQTEPHGRLVSILTMFGADEFSLETVVQGIPGGQLINVTPLVNAEASISEDIVVFDIEAEGSPQWCRIWALRESKLPTHIRIWDPRDGECVDVILTYSREQQSIFFDPQAFSSEMKKSGNRKINLAYMFLEDSGGKQIFPGTVDEHQAFEVTTQTIDGQEWSLGNYRGKTVLVHFWNEDNYHHEASWMKEIYQRFGNRDDFVMVGVSLRKDAESSKSICKKQGIGWIQLHEPGMGYKNSLARAFGVDDIYCCWMVWKDGTIEKLHGHLEAAAGQVEASVIGFTYASGMWLNKKIQERQKLHGPLRAEEIIELYGDSYTVEDSSIVPGRKRWVYEAYNKDKSRIRKFFVAIENETVVGFGSSSSLVDPATVTISFSSEFIRDHIESQVPPDVFEKMYKDYQVVVSAEKGNRISPFAEGSIKPDDSCSRRLPPGIYDIVIIIGPANEHGAIIQTIKKIVLRKNVQLNKNESKTIRFE